MCLGCGDNLAPPPDADLEVPFETAPHTLMPLVFSHAGVVLSEVQLVTITFDGHALRDQLEVFGDMVVRSLWYQSVGVEYGVSAGRHVKKLRLAAPPRQAQVPGEPEPPVTDADIRDLVIGLIERGELPAPPKQDNQLLYMVYIPPGVGFVGPSKVPGVPSYHEMVKLENGAKFPLAVVVPIGDDLAAATTAAAHQLIDAATNPYEPPQDGYYTDPPMTDPWSLVSGEVADLCEGENPVAEGEFALPRVYSNMAATAGKSPCVPFVPDDTWMDVSARPSQIQRVRPGESVRFELTGWSTRQLPPWQVSTVVTERSDLSDSDMMPRLSNNQINNRSMVTLTLTAPSDAVSGQVGGVYVLSGTNRRRWAVGFIVQTASPCSDCDLR